MKLYPIEKLWNALERNGVKVKEFWDGRHMFLKVSAEDVDGKECFTDIRVTEMEKNRYSYRSDADAEIELVVEFYDHLKCLEESNTGIETIIKQGNVKTVRDFVTYVEDHFSPDRLFLPFMDDKDVRVATDEILDVVSDIEETFDRLGEELLKLRSERRMMLLDRRYR